MNSLNSPLCVFAPLREIFFKTYNHAKSQSEDRSAKVDELMAICDALKAQLQESQTTQLQLADTIVEQAVT